MRLGGRRPLPGEYLQLRLPAHAHRQGRLACVLDDLDLPRPRTIPVDAEENDSARRYAGLEHAFLKPRDSAAFHAQFGVKAFQVTSAADLAARLADVRRLKLSVQLQEYVPGPPSNHFYVEGFIDREGRRRALFVRQRLRMYPADFGNSTFFESVDPSAVSDAVVTLTTLLSHVRYRGMFSAEFKRDARDGVCRLIEVNARPWWFVEFAGQCGMNVCAMSVLDALGEEVPETIGYRVGKSCVYPYYDYFACRELHARGELSVGEWLRSWLRSTQPVLRWSDPISGAQRYHIAREAARVVLPSSRRLMGWDVEVRILEQDAWPAWEKFVAAAPGGSVYSLPGYLDALCTAVGGRYRILGVMRGEEIVGGVALYERTSRGGTFVSPRLLLYYNGVVVRRYETQYPSEATARHVKILTALETSLSGMGLGSINFRSRALYDVRPFVAKGWTVAAELQLRRATRPPGRVGEGRAESPPTHRSGAKCRDDAIARRRRVRRISFGSTRRRSTVTAPASIFRATCSANSARRCAEMDSASCTRFARRTARPPPRNSFCSGPIRESHRLRRRRSRIEQARRVGVSTMECIRDPRRARASRATTSPTRRSTPSRISRASSAGRWSSRSAVQSPRSRRFDWNERARDRDRARARRRRRAGATHRAAQRKQRVTRIAHRRRVVVRRARARGCRVRVRFAGHADRRDLRGAAFEPHSLDRADARVGCRVHGERLRPRVGKAGSADHDLRPGRRLRSGRPCRGKARRRSARPFHRCAGDRADGRAIVSSIRSSRFRAPDREGRAASDERGQLTSVVREAFALATAPEPGPIFVEFAARALRERAADSPTERAIAPRAPRGDTIDDRSLAALVESVAAAKRPLFFVACDCGDAAEALADVATRGTRADPRARALARGHA